MITIEEVKECCGNCASFVYELTDGTGYCSFYLDYRYCADWCHHWTEEEIQNHNENKNKLMCNCIEKIKKLFLEKMKQEAGFTEVTEAPFFVNYSIYPSVKPYFPVVGKYMQGKKSRRYKVNLYPTFCQFCGKKYEDGKIENELWDTI